MDHEELTRKIEAKFGYNPLTTKGKIKYFWGNYLSKELLAGLIGATICLYAIILPTQKQKLQSALEQRVETQKIQRGEPEKYDPNPSFCPKDNNPHHFSPKGKKEF